MQKTLNFEHRYPVSPDRLFALVTDLDTLDAVSKPWLQFHHLPSGPVHAGQIIDVAVSLFGVFPVLPYRMQVTDCDPVTRRMRSLEDGAGVRQLVHELTVSAEGRGARLVDRVRIDAGWRTPFAAMCARLLYRWRHHARLRLLRRGACD